MRLLLVILLALGVTAPSSAAEAFRWQDADGHIHYGDEPPEHAQQLRPVKTYECDTEQCQEELQQRYEEAIAASQALDEWLREIDNQRSQQATARPQTSSSVFIGPAVVVPTIPSIGPLIDNPFVGSLPKLSRPHHHREPKIRRTRTRFQYPR